MPLMYPEKRGRYIFSNKLGIGFPILIPLSLAASMFAGALLSVAILSTSRLYFSLIAAVLCGSAIGYVIRTLAKMLHCRNPVFVTALGLMCALLACYTCTNEYSLALLKRIPNPPGLFL